MDTPKRFGDKSPAEGQRIHVWDGADWDARTYQNWQEHDADDLWLPQPPPPVPGPVGHNGWRIDVFGNGALQILEPRGGAFSTGNGGILRQLRTMIDYCLERQKEQGDE